MKLPERALVGLMTLLIIINSIVLVAGLVRRDYSELTDQATKIFLALAVIGWVSAASSYRRASETWRARALRAENRR